MKGILSWHIARVVARRVIPALLVAAIALMADAELLDGALVERVAAALRG